MKPRAHLELLAYRDIVMRIRFTERALEAVRERLNALPAAVGDHVQTHYEDYKPEIISTMERLAAELDALTEDKRTKTRPTQLILNSLPAPKERAVLEARYMLALDWPEVARVAFGDEDDVERREKWYIKRCQNIHGDALRHLGGHGKSA
jgi:seryl-tRNA synthetase